LNIFIEKYIILSKIPKNIVTPQVRGCAVGASILSAISLNSPVGLLTICQLFHLRKRPRYIPKLDRNSSPITILFFNKGLQKLPIIRSIWLKLIKPNNKPVHANDKIKTKSNQIGDEVRDFR
jgi:hypothetical protein